MDFIDDKKINELIVKPTPTLEDRLVLDDIDGTKTVTIESLKALIGANLIVNDLNMMKSATFNEGEICHTLGYHTIGDGGGAKYKILYKATAKADERTWIELDTSDTLRAKLIPENGNITPEQFGAYGDGIHDDTDAINECINTGLNIKFNPKNTYFVRGLNLHSNMILDLNGCTIKGSIIKNTSDSDTYENLTIKNGIVDCLKTNTPIYLTCITDNLVIEDIDFINTASSFGAILVDNTINGKINKCTFKSSYASITDSVSTFCAIRVDGYTYKQDISSKGSNLTISNCTFDKFNFAIYGNGQNKQITDIRRYINVNNCTAINMTCFIQLSGKFTDISLSDIIVNAPIKVGEIFTDNSTIGFKISEYSSIIKTNVSLRNITSNTQALISGSGTNADNLYIIFEGSILCGYAFLNNVLATINLTNSIINSTDRRYNREPLLLGNNDGIKVIDKFPTFSEYSGDFSCSSSDDRYYIFPIRYIRNHTCRTWGHTEDAILKTIEGGYVGQIIRLYTINYEMTVSEEINGNIKLLGDEPVKISPTKSIVLQKLSSGSNGIWVQI